MPVPDRARFDGAIAGLGTGSGLRLVIGMWPRSPFGFFTDVMLQRPDDTRLLLAPSAEVADYVASTYTFDEVRVSPVHLLRAADRWSVHAGDLSLVFTTGRRTPVGWLLSWVPREVASSPLWSSAIDPVARRVMRGVRTRGSARAGRREYYGALDQHQIVAVEGTWQGDDLGGLAPLEPPVTFGFGSAPSEPSLVRIVTTVRSARAQSGST